jgi:hypothetical protein
MDLFKKSTILILLVISTLAVTESAVLLSEDQRMEPKDISDKSQLSATQNETYITATKIETDPLWYFRHWLKKRFFG